MPQLTKPQHVRFVRHWIKNGCAARAYLHAGYRPTNRNSLDASASRLLRHAKVQRLIQQSRRQMARKHEITVETLLNDLAEDRALAREKGQVAAAIQATQLSAKLVGLLVDRKESGAPGDFAGLQSADEVLELVKRELGDETAAVLAAALTRREEVGSVEDLPPIAVDMEVARDEGSTLN